MKEAIMKSKFYVGLALLVQSVMCIIFFFSQWNKRKSLASTFLAIGAAGGLTGAYLVYKNAKEVEREQKILSAMDAFCEEEYDFDDEWVDLRDKEEEAAPVVTDNETTEAE